MTRAPDTPVGADRSALRTVHRSLLTLAAVLGLGVLVELATARHWHGPEQLIAWAALALVAVGVALLARPTAALHRAGRILLAAVAGASLFGVWEHLGANLDAGPLDFRYATTWSDLPVARQWWLAVSGGVGASPPLVPLVLALVVALVLLADLTRRAQVPLVVPTRAP